MPPRPPLVQPPPTSAVAVLFHRLLTRLDAPRTSAPGPKTGKPRCAPPGHRSGEGSDSVLTYLAEDLLTRPGALDD